MPNKRIVVFADGTGNAFTQQESNIWRLYRALDQSSDDQIARYIPGVGTSSIKPLATLDQVIGFGVPSNVRELYRFICWNWEPGDEIWLFGFSRGAFTIRSLVGMIGSQGLMPTEINGRTVTHAEMARNCKYAWRAYRADKAPPSGFTVAAARAALKFLRGLTSGPKRFEQARSEAARVLPVPSREPIPGNESRMTSRPLKDKEVSRKAPPLKFLGLFDTVEAYGMPVEELKPLIDRYVFPIRFRDRRCSDLVTTVRHALALDDERTSFHPVRFDQTNEAPASWHERRIQEVWFPGMHSNVGGGYPDDTLAHVPLHWVAREAESLGLRFATDAPDGWYANSSPLGHAHDSRAGTAALFRYDPREISRGAEFGGEPVLHHAVPEKMAYGSDNYAPLGVPDTALVLDAPAHAGGACPGTLTALLAQAGQSTTVPSPVKFGTASSFDGALRVMTRPAMLLRDRAEDVVWWRRVHYFLLLTLLGLIALMPVAGTVLHETILGPFSPLGARIGEISSETVQESKYWYGDVKMFFRGIVEFLGDFVPGFAKPWIMAWRDHTTLMTLLVALAVWIFKRGFKLQHIISDLNLEAWRNKTVGAAAGLKKRPSEVAASFIRKSQLFNSAYRVVSGYAFPVFFGALTLIATLILVSRATVNALSASGRICREANPLANPAAPPKLQLPQPEIPLQIKEPFVPKSPCWATGVWVEKGRTYTLWIRETEKFFDRTTPAELPGFTKSGSLAHGALSSYAFKRWPSEAWFQPIYQIGELPVEEGLLNSADGDQPVDLTVAEKERPRKISPGVFSAKITPKQSGPLYLYVNDAMIGIPLYGTLDSFYDNNEKGKAEVTILLRKSPPPRP